MWDGDGDGACQPTANSIAGSYTVTAMAAGVATGASFALTNLAGAAATIAATAGDAAERRDWDGVSPRRWKRWWWMRITIQCPILSTK